MRYALLPSLALLSLVSACSPTAGGQTGDPGVNSFESLDPGPGEDNGGIAGECISEGARVLRQDARWFGGPDFQVEKLSEQHVVVFDPARGLAIVDVSGDAPRLSARVALPRSVGTLNVSGQYAFVSRRNVLGAAARFGNGYPQIGDESELIAIDLSDPSAPRIEQRLALEQAPRFSMSLTSGGPTRVYVVSDDAEAGSGSYGGCGGRDKSIRLTSYEWLDGSFAKRAELLLNDKAAPDVSIAPFGDKLALIRNASSYQTQLSVLDLSARDGTISESERVDADNVVALHADGPDSFRVVSSARGGRTGKSEHAIDVYGIHEGRMLVRESRCIIGSDSLGIDIAFSPRHVFVMGGSRGDGINPVTTISLNDDGTCAVSAPRGRGRNVRWLGALAKDRLLEVEGNGRESVNVRLLDDGDLHVIDELVVTGLDEATFDRALALPGSDHLLLSLGFYYEREDQSYDGSVQLLEFAEDKLAARGTVAPAGVFLAPDTAQALVWSKRQLARVGLDNLAQPKLSETLDVSPRFASVAPFEQHWLRLRSLDPVEHRDLLTKDELFSANGKGRLELVALDQDPDLAAEEVAIEANPYGRLVRVGALVVSIGRAFPPPVGRPDDLKPQATLFEVFDLSDPKQPKRSGELRIDELALQAFCASCVGSVLEGRDMVLEHGILLRAYGDDGELALRMLDLSDPARPSLSDPIQRPENEPILSAFSDGTSAYYTYRVHTGESQEVAKARFYFRRIDFSTWAAPSLGEPVNVPGQLVAIAGEMLYTREVVRNQDALSMRIHRLALDGDKATLKATRELGARNAAGIELTGSGRLLLDLQEPLQKTLYGTWTEITPTELRVLDANTLNELGGGYVGPGASRLGVVDSYALYSVAQGVVLMDLRDPAAPHAQAYIPTYGYGAGQGLLTADSLVIEDSGALKRYALDFENLR